MSALVVALQEPGGSVGGVILDAADGRPLVGAVVSLPDLDRAVVTDSRGRYRFPAVPPGPQHLAARYLGYAPRTVHALVPANGLVEISIALAAVPARLTRVVVRWGSAEPGAIRPGIEAHPDRLMTIGEIRDQPLLAEADVLEALGGGAIALDPETPMGVHIHGAPADQTAYLLDGIPVFLPHHAAGLFGAFNPDAIGSAAVWASVPAPEREAVLGGLVTVNTRRPGEHWGMQGGVSTTQARLTIDGPLPRRAGGVLASVRGGFPGLIASGGEGSYLQGEGGDRIVSAIGTARGGVLRALYFDSENELTAASDSLGSRRHAFEWQSRSTGGEWRQVGEFHSVALRAWVASGRTRLLWREAPDRDLAIDGERRDVGVAASGELRKAGGTTRGFVRVERIRTVVAGAESSGGSTADALATRAAVPGVVTIGLAHERPVGEWLRFETGGSVARVGGDVAVSPEAGLRWVPGERMSLRLSVERRHQFVQSLRNDESLVGAVFPAEPFVAAGTPGVPVARGDQIAVSLEVRPGPSTGLVVHGYARRAAGLLLAAASTDKPVAFGDVAIGSARSQGASVELTRRAARYATLAGYGWQRTRVRHSGGTYVPRYASRHRIEAGAIGYPSATVSVRVGAAWLAGRRGTPAYGALEWESCNLLDLGCEFGGTPRTDPASLGSARLPAYLRVDIGARKHWHLRTRGRDVAVAVFATLTNVTGRMNTLIYAVDPSTELSTPITMRPLSPLVVGLDWRF